jgi:hypothetical protein
MKPLTLTQEQRDKLLEMVRSLFPKYKVAWYWDDDEFETIENAWKANYSFSPEVTSFLIFDWHMPTAFTIHWFEFCALHLSPEIGTSTELLFRHLEEEYLGEHVVDHLYDQFKKFKP